MKRKNYTVAFYERLSREDGDNMESESITNQRGILQKFLKNTTENLTLVDEYVDDGYSGGNFDRPGWKILLDDIEKGKINTIITKDLSRMGRDYITMGEYIERIFPEKGIRYIAINDDIDTLYETPGLEFLQFKLVFNDYYLKDTSKKIRKILRSKKESGQFLGWKAIYGYKKDPDNKHHLIVDENVRDVVERMFKLTLDGKSPQQIANIFSQEKIPTPSVYANLNRAKRSTAYELWSGRTIGEMLSNPTYMGSLTQGIRRKLNYKSKKEVRTQREDWIISDNTHEAIVDKNTFLTAQEMLKKNRYQLNNSNKQLLSGFMFCKECGHAIGINKSSDGKRYYCHCSYYTKYSKFNLCTCHCCNYKKLEEMVLYELKQMCLKYVDSSKFKDEIEKIKKENDFKTKLQREITILEKKIEHNNNHIDLIYEDKLDNKIDFDMFNRLSIKYKNEIDQYKKQKIALEKEIKDYNKENKNKQSENTLKIIEEYLSFEKPTKNILVNLIDKILISEDKRVEVYYKFRVE